MQEAEITSHLLLSFFLPLLETAKKKVVYITRGLLYFQNLNTLTLN